MKKNKGEKKVKKKKTLKDRLFTLVWLAILIPSIAAFIYPSVSNTWNQYRNDQLSKNYDRKVKNASKEKLKEEWKRARKYNEGHSYNYIKGKIGQKKYPLYDPYKSYLNIAGDEIMGTVVIPKINIKLPIYHGLGAYALSHGCGHIEGTSLPVGGKGTHSVLAAHRGLASAKLFTDLDQMKNGDVFYLKILDKTLAYEVDKISIVDPADTSPIRLFKDKDYVTLLTCTPYAINSSRLLVRGRRIPLPSNAKKDIAKTSWLTMDLVYKLLIIGLIFIAIVLIFEILKRRKRSKKQKAKNKKT